MKSSVKQAMVLVLFANLVYLPHVQALALAEMELNSSLNQPLKVRIVLLTSDQDELNSLEVNISRDASLDRFSLPTLKHKLVIGETGNFLLITSDDPIKEPIVNFSVEMTWSTGRILRDYSLLIDPQN